MADATRLSFMSKQIEDNKQATDDIRAQMADLMKHQADLSKSIEAMLSKLVSPSSGQTSRASGLNASPSGCLTNSTTTPLLPDPPDTIRYGKELVGNGEAEDGIPKGLSTRLTKVGFPSFDGTKLRNWVHRCEQFFMLDGTPPEMKVRLASVYLDGEAFEWHRNYINSRYGVYPLWPDYVADLTGRFGEDIDDPLSVLVKVKQDGDSVEKYLARFESALTMVSLPATHSLSIFMANMNPQLALHVRQFAARTVSEAARFAKLHESYLHFSPSKQDRAPFSPYQNQNNQFHYNSPNTTSSLPPLETTKTLPYKPNIPTETDMEKSPKKLYCEEIQESGMRGLCMSSDGSYASGHHLGSKKSQVFVVESDDEESFDVREPSEVTVEEIIDESVDMIQEEKSTPENESSPEVSPQILLSQFQVSLSSLEPGHRYYKESLVVVNDLSYDHECVIGKTIGSICDSELGQDNSYDEEEFIGLNLGKLLKNERLFSIIRLLGLNDMSCWTQLLRQQIFPKSWRFKFKTESSGEAILLNTYRAVCLGVYNRNLETDLEIFLYEYKNQMLMLGYHGLEVQVLSCLQEFGEGSKMGTRIVLCWKKLASSLWFLHGKKLLDAGQKMQSMLVYDEEKNGLRNTGAVNKKEKYIFSGNIKLIKQSLSGDNELIWTQFSSLVKASEMSVLGRDKWKWSEKHRMYNKAWKFKYIQRLMLSVLLQMEQYKLLQGRTIKCKMRKKEVLRRIKQSIFIEMQFHMKNNSEFNFQANTRVLELIKDKASRKRKLCKNWWFKYKLSTWFSEALHFWRKRKYEKLQRASEHMMCELIHKIRKACQCVVHETNETASHVWYWWKTKAEIVQIVLKPIMHLKGKEETFSFKDAATNCSSKTKISGHVLKQVFGRATHGLFLKQSLSQFLLHIQNRDCSFFGYMLMATSDCFGTLLEIPDKEIAKPHNIYVLKALILWKWYPPEQATWIFSELIQNSLDMSIFGKSRTWLLCKVRIVHDLKDLRQFTRAGIKFHLKHKWRSKFGSSKLTRTWTRQKAWPRVLPRLHVRAFHLSFLRTRMFSNREYCDRKYCLSQQYFPVHIYSLGLSNYSV